jgi:hypothetical protein
MPNRSRPNKLTQPKVPEVSAGTWRALVPLADEFQRLAPWEWMHDSHVVGLRHPLTKEVLLCSILGRLRQVFALLVYRHDTGRRWLLNTILNDGDPGGFERLDTAFEQNLVKVEFVAKRELAKEDKAVLSAAADTVKRHGAAWPQFRSLIPGGYPWHMTEDEARTLLFVLPRVTAVARLMHERPEIWDEHLEGDVAFLPEGFDPAAEELSLEQLGWQPMIPPPELPPEKVSLDQATVAKLLKLEQASGFHLELDVAYAPFPIACEDRPRFPKLVLAVDRASGFVGGFQLADFSDPDGATTLGTVLRNTLTQLKHRPEAIHVQRARLEAMLAGVAEELGIPVHLDEELEELNFARASMEEHFLGA